VAEEKAEFLSPKLRKKRMAELEKHMARAVKNLEFEKAALYRDELKKLKRHALELS